MFPPAVIESALTMKLMMSGSRRIPARSKSTLPPASAVSIVGRVKLSVVSWLWTRSMLIRSDVVPIEPLGASISRMLVMISDGVTPGATILEVLDRMLPFVLMMVVVPIGLLIVPSIKRSCALLSKRLFCSMLISPWVRRCILMLNKRLTLPDESSSTCGPPWWRPR